MFWGIGAWLLSVAASAATLWLGLVVRSTIIPHGGLGASFVGAIHESGLFLVLLPTSSIVAAIVLSGLLGKRRRVGRIRACAAGAFVLLGSVIAFAPVTDGGRVSVSYGIVGTLTMIAGPSAAAFLAHLQQRQRDAARRVERPAASR